MLPAILYKLMDKKLKRGETCNIKVGGISMNPILYNGDIITIISAEYKEGDIIVFKYEGELLVHRLLKMENKIFICKGDNAIRYENVTDDYILGKVIEIEREGKKISII